MASPSSATPNQIPKTPLSHSSTTGTTPFSSLIKTVLLTDWWLNKAEVDSKGRRLGVGGNTSNRTPVIRVFCSGAIAKRHDNLSLETVDGVTITLTGLINRARTLENGLPSKVCNHFVLGFPNDWEEFGAQCFGEESTNGALASRNTNSDGFKMSSDGGGNSSLSISFADLPVTRVCDLMMISSGDYKECKLTRSIFDHMLNEYGGNAFKYGGSSVQLHEECNSQVMTKDSLLNETGPSLHSNEENNSGIMTKNCLLDEDLRNNQEKNLSSTTFISPGFSDPFSASEASGNRCGGMITKTNASNVSISDKLSEEKMEDSIDNSAARRSRRFSGVSTRSKTRLKSVRSDPEDNFMEVEVALDNSFVRRSGHGKDLSDPFPTSEASGNKCRGQKTTRDGSSGSFTNILSQDEKKLKGGPDKSAVRRSNRLKNLKK